MKKALKRIAAILIIFLIVVFLWNYYRIFPISKKELSSLLRINLVGDAIQINDAILEDYVIETWLVLYYEITEDEFQKREYYQYTKESYDFDLQNEYYKDDLIDWLSEFSLDYNDIAYKNYVFSTYKGADFSTDLYIFQNNSTTEGYSVVLFSDIPTRFYVEL